MCVFDGKMNDGREINVEANFSERNPEGTIVSVTGTSME